MHVYEKPARRVAWLLGFIDLRELLSSVEVHGDDGFEFVNDRETTLNLSNDTVLFRQGRHWHGQSTQVTEVKVWLCSRA
jgi:hypothetical protein